MSKKNKKKKGKKGANETPEVKEEKTPVVGNRPYFSVMIREKGGAEYR